jgi:taurine dioxygenase
MRVKPISRSFGAEISGINLNLVTEDELRAIVCAFNSSGGLLLVRSQPNLSPEVLIRFARAFGSEIEKNEKYPKEFLLPGHPEILRVGNSRGGDGEYNSLFVQAESKQEDLLWHADDSFRDPQPLGSILYCVAAPKFSTLAEEQGKFSQHLAAATWFADCSAAFDALSPERQQELEKLIAHHDYDHLNEILRKNNPHRKPLSAEMKRGLPPIKRALVSVHPLSGRRSLCAIPCHTSHVDRLPIETGQRLVQELMDFATQDHFTYGHLWREGDLVLWDNRCTLHSPTPFDNDGQSRLMYRLTITP